MSEAAAQYELTFESRPGYLYARVKADSVSEDSAVEYLTKIAEKSDELRSTRVMFHRDIPEMLPTSTLFHVAKLFRELISDRRVAFVNPYYELDEDFAFGLMVGTNRGADYNIFRNDKIAESWLLA